MRRGRHLPGRNGGLAMEAMDHPLELAGIAAIGKQHRPAAGIARQPECLLARCARLERRRLRLPGHGAEHRGTEPLMLDLGDGAADLRRHGNAELLVLEHQSAAAMVLHLMAPAMRPWMKYFWNRM